MFDRCVRTLCLPFTGTHSLQIRTQINRLCRAAFPHLDIRFVFRSTKRLSTFFSFKDKIPKALKSGVVYSFTCRCCSASYVGQTTRHLHTRVSEHLGITPITGKLCKNPPQSSIFSHLTSTGHTASIDDFKILSSCSDDQELLIHESFPISKMKPSLNVQGSSIPLHLFWSLSFLCFVCMCCRLICMFLFLFVTSFHYPFLSLRFCVPHTLL
jgi:hypothetical protein